MMREKRQAMSMRKLFRTDEKRQCLALSNLEKLIESLTLLIGSAGLMRRYQPLLLSGSATTSRFYRVLVCASIVVVITMSLASCVWPGTSGGGSGGSSSDSPVNVNVSYTFPSFSATRCTGNITWTFTPVQLTGSVGKSDQISDTISYDEFANVASGECVLKGGQLGLRKGSWQIAGSNVGSCTVMLNARSTIVAFRQGNTSCTHIP
jgi:hypothetical protein